MSTKYKIAIERGYSFPPDCFYNLMNKLAENRGITGRLTTINDTYIFTLEGPVAAMQAFVRFIWFADGAIGRVIDVTEEEDAVVPDAILDRPIGVQDEQRSDIADDAVVPTTSRYVLRREPRLCERQAVVPRAHV